GPSCRSREFGGLEAIVERFVAAARAAGGAQSAAGVITTATFGIAGPVRDGRSTTTNLPWVVDARRLAALLRLPSCGLINDLEATAYGVLELGPGDQVPLAAGAVGAGGNSAIIAAGRGLGEAGVFWVGRRH